MNAIDPVRYAARHGDHSLLCAPQEPHRCSTHPVPPYNAETYINFWDDTDSLLTDCTAFYREEHGIKKQIVATEVD